MSLIELTDTVNDILKKISKGNPGALSVCMGMIKMGDYRENTPMGGMAYLLMLDSFEIYGDDIWMLHADVCSQNVLTAMMLLRACQIGKVSREALCHAIQHDGEGIDVGALVGEAETFMSDKIKLIEGD